MTLGEQIKKGREVKNLSQEELAEQIGVSRQAVSKWESGLSVPSGTNRRSLCQILSLDLPEPTKASTGRRAFCFLGWVCAGLALAALICTWVQLAKTPGADMPQAQPALHSIHFYNKAQEEVFPEALWYNSAEIESILIQWTGGIPETVKMFFTPSGSETIEETELLTTKAPADGEQALLLSASPLHRESLMGHLYFELHFGTGDVIVTDSLYNVFFDPELTIS